MAKSTSSTDEVLAREEELGPPETSKNLTHTLPVELIHEINELLEEPTSTTFRATSKGLYTFVQPPKDDNHIILKRMFCKLLDRDSFNRIRELEQENTPPPQLRACGACMSAHPAAQFSAKQLALPPQERRCLGHERVLRLCEHTEIPLSHLPIDEPNDLDDPRPRSARITCWASHDDVPDAPYLYFHATPDVLGNNISTLRDISLPELAPSLHPNPLPGAPAQKGITTDAVFAALRRRERVSLCPHMCVADLPERVLLEIDEDREDMEVQPGMLLLDEWTFWCLYGDCEECGASFAVVRPTGTGEVVVRVMRELRNAYEADDPKWLAQLEQAKPKIWETEEEQWDEAGWSLVNVLSLHRLCTLVWESLAAAVLT